MPPMLAPTSPQARLRLALTNADTYATTLLLIFVDRYGTDAFAWSPETIRLQIADDFGVTLPKVCFDRLMCAISLQTTNYFYQRLPHFIVACNVLSGADYDPSTFDLADAMECAWGLTEGMLICPPEGDEPFSDDIRHYLTAVLRDEGFVTAPDVLKLAIGSDLSQQVQYNFADDPGLFEGIYKNQLEKTQGVTATLKENLQDMLQEIVNLPLENGKVVELMKRLPADIRPVA